MVPSGHPDEAPRWIASFGAEWPDSARRRLQALRRPHHQRPDSARQRLQALRPAASSNGIGGRSSAFAGRIQRGRRATFSSRPAAVIDTNSDEPPAEKNGSVRPVTGISPVTPPRLIDRLHAEPRRDAAGEQHAEAVGRGERGLDAEPRRAA